MANTLYYWVGRAVVWLACIGLGSWAGGQTLAFIWKHLPAWPWLMWLLFYGQRALGYHNRAKDSFGPPFYYNDGEMRAATKKYRPLARQMQANIARYNRRRWAAASLLH